MSKKRREPKFDRAVIAPPPPLPGLVLGGLLGALAGSASLGLELAVLAWMGVGVPDPEGIAALLGIYAVIGAMFGGLHGATGLWGGPWALAWTLSATSVVLGAKIGAASASVGIPAVVGVAVAVALGLVLAQPLCRFGGQGPIQMGAATLLGCFFPIAGALNLHLLPSSTDGLSVLVDWVVLAPVALMAVLIGVTSSGERAPVPHLVLANLVAWAVLAPRLADGHPPPPSTTLTGQPVVLITVEGLRTDAAARERAPMPVMTELIAAGARFPKAHTTSPWAIPALASILTGRAPYHHGAAMNDGRTNHMGPLGARVPTLAQVYRSEGYVTGAAVGDAWLDSFGLQTGFTWYADTPERGPLPLWLDTIAVAVGIVPWPIRQDAAAVTDRALGFVEGQQSGRWLLWVHYADAGGPFLSTEQDRKAVGRTMRPWPVDAWEASLLTVDRELGRLLAGLPEDALVVLVGTHGIELEEGRPRGARVPEGVWDGHTLFQETIAVPMAIRGPRIERRSHERLVSVIDLMPTLLELSGIDEMRRVDGDAICELQNEVFEEDKRPVQAMSLRWGEEQQAIRVGDDKIIVRADGTSPLMDLNADWREITGKPADPTNDQIERRLRGALLPIGSGPEHFERAPSTERLGRWFQANWDRRETVP